MEKFIILISNRNDVHDRHFIIRNTIEEAKEVASSFSNGYYVEIIKGETIPQQINVFFIVLD